MMFGNLWGRKTRVADRLYGELMAASRAPVFYAGFGVADSVEGRFEMLMLFVGLVVHRLAAEPAGRDAALELSERFVAGMQRSLRDLGYEDSGLKRRVKSVASAFYGRTEAVAAALTDAGPDALAGVLSRNVYGGPAPEAGRLADHIRAYAAALAALPVVEIAAGRLPSLPPSVIPAGQHSSSDISP